MLNTVPCAGPSSRRPARPRHHPAPMAGMQMRSHGRRSSPASMPMASMDAPPSPFSSTIDFFFSFPAAGPYTAVFQLARADGSLLTADQLVVHAAAAPVVGPGAVKASDAAVAPRAAAAAFFLLAAAGVSAARWAGGAVHWQGLPQPAR